MQKTIEELFYGMSPSEEIMPKHENYFEEAKEATAAEAEFCKKLTEEETKAFNDMMLKNMMISYHGIAQAFVDGFKIGANLIIEVLCD